MPYLQEAANFTRRLQIQEAIIMPFIKIRMGPSLYQGTPKASKMITTRFKTKEDKD
jgi:hypothetical protein